MFQVFEAYVGRRWATSYLKRHKEKNSVWNRYPSTKKVKTWFL